MKQTAFESTKDDNYEQPGELVKSVPDAPVWKDDPRDDNFEQPGFVIQIPKKFTIEGIPTKEKR